MRLKKRHLLTLVVVVLGALLPAQALAASDPVSVVASGLDTPRGLAMLGDLAIIAEAGHAANTAQVSSVNTETAAHHTIAGGLFSTFSPEGDIVGVEGVAVRHGQIYAIFGVAPQNAGQDQAGQLVSVHQGGVSEIAQVGGFDYSWTVSTHPPPHPGQEHDANPNAVLVTPDGFLVADSGSNTLTSVSRNGKKLAIVHYWNNRYNGFPMDEVPTCVASTGDSLWVGTLAGNLWNLGEDGVTQVVPRDKSGKPLLGRVTGCTSSGSALYIVSMFGRDNPEPPPTSSDFARGNVVKYDTESGQGSELANSFSSPALLWPYTPAVGHDGNLYITAGTVCQSDGKANGLPPGTPGCAGGGRLVKIHLGSDDNQEGGDN